MPANNPILACGSHVALDRHTEYTPLILPSSDRSTAEVFARQFEDRSASVAFPEASNGLQFDRAEPTAIGDVGRIFSVCHAALDDTKSTPIRLKRDELSLNHHRALVPCLHMIFSENRCTLFRIMR